MGHRELLGCLYRSSYSYSGYSAAFNFGEGDRFLVECLRIGMPRVNPETLSYVLQDDYLSQIARRICMINEIANAVTKVIMKLEGECMGIDEYGINIIVLRAFLGATSHEQDVTEMKPGWAEHLFSAQMPPSLQLHLPYSWNGMKGAPLICRNGADMVDHLAWRGF